MSPLRLVCHVTAPGDEDLPSEDAHPFWVAIDELADAVAEAARARGIDPDALALTSESEDGSLLTQSSDAPAWAAYFWIYLPRDGAAQAMLLPIILEHLSRARDALPAAGWKVTLGEDPLVWDGGRFHLRS
jgi:hypothetical protein